MVAAARSNLSRISEILDQFPSADAALKTSAIVANTGMTRSTGYGLIHALVNRGWLERMDNGLLQLGPKATGLFYGPLETALAFRGTPRQLGFGRSTSRGKNKQDISLPALNPDLIRLVDTSVFARASKARIGFANASTSNPWRLALLASMRYAARVHAHRIDTLDIRTSDNDPAAQLSQIDDLVKAGIDALLISCCTTESEPLNQRLVELAEGGLPIIAVDRLPGDPSCLVTCVMSSTARIGHVSAVWIGEYLREPSRVWVLSGVKGASPSARSQEAALKAFSTAGHITVEALADTDWTEAGGYAAVERLFGQYGEVPAAIFADSGLQGIGSLKWFLAHGKRIPIHSGGALNGMYKLALRNKVPFVAVDYPAAMGARAVEAALDVLEGKALRRRIEVVGPVILPRGHETLSVRADIWAEEHVRWDLEDDAILSQGASLPGRPASLRIRADGPQATISENATYSRSVELFEALLDAPVSRLCFRPVDVLDSIGRAKSTGYRVLTEAEAIGLVQRDLQGNYCRGPTARRIGFRALGCGELSDIPGPLLPRLRGMLDLTVALGAVRQSELNIGPFSLGRGSQFVRPDRSYTIVSPTAAAALHTMTLVSGSDSEARVSARVMEIGTTGKCRFILAALSSDPQAEFGKEVDQLLFDAGRQIATSIPAEHRAQSLG